MKKILKLIEIFFLKALNNICLKYQSIKSKIYFDLYQTLLNIYFNFFKGPLFSRDYYNEDNKMFDENTVKQPLFSPVLSSTFLNRGLWYIFNLDIWVGSTIIEEKPKLEVINNNQRSAPLRYKRKLYFRRMVNHHCSILAKLLYITMWCVLVNFEILAVYLAYSQYGWKFYLFYFFFLRFYVYLFADFFYHKSVRFIEKGIKLCLYKPIVISFDKEYVYGVLNNNEFLTERNYFFEIKRLFLKKYRTLVKKIKELPLYFRKNDIGHIARKIDNLIFLKKKLNIKTLFLKLDNFWILSKTRDKTLLNFFLNFTKRRMVFNNKYYLPVLNLRNFLHFIGFYYMSFIRILIISDKLFIIKGWYLSLVLAGIAFGIYFKQFLIFLLFLNALVISVYYYYCFKKNSKNVYNPLINKYLLNSDPDLNFKLMSRFSFFNFPFKPNTTNISLDVYIVLFKIDYNISQFEKFFNNMLLEQEYFYKKRQFIFSDDDVTLKRQAVLKKYDIFLKNRFRYKKDYNDIILNNIVQKEIKDLNKKIRSLVDENNIYVYIRQSSKKLNKYSYISYVIGKKSDNIDIKDFNLSDSQKYYYYKYGLKLVK